MATVLLRGGLGNQMFQYAAGLRLALKTGAPLILDTTYLNDRTPRRNFIPRNYGLDIFRLQAKFTLLSRISSRYSVPGLWLGLDLLGHPKAVREKNSHVFDAGVLKVSGESFLMGFWQSEKYFFDTKDEVRHAFEFREPLRGEAAAIAKVIGSTDSVALHVRRGDYVTSKKVQAIMGQTNVDYYEKSIAIISSRVKTPHFFIFSDDIAWCKQNIKTHFPSTYLDHNSAGPKDGYHLQLMSLCKHNIIANSTFSWWGAWLNRNGEKVVIAPGQWYLENRQKYDITFPDGWIKI